MRTVPGPGPAAVLFPCYTSTVIRVPAADQHGMGQFGRRTVPVPFRRSWSWSVPFQRAFRVLRGRTADRSDRDGGSGGIRSYYAHAPVPPVPTNGNRMGIGITERRRRTLVSVTGNGRDGGSDRDGGPEHGRNAAVIPSSVTYRVGSVSGLLCIRGGRSDGCW
jgi:hypothetical protein